MKILITLLFVCVLFASVSAEAAEREPKPAPGKASDRYATGLAMQQKVSGQDGTKAISRLAGITPDFARYITEFFGDIYSRPGLDLKSREIAVVAALTAMGNAAPQLKVHIAAALNVGCTREEIIETIMQMGIYAGFPAALNGLFAAEEVFAEQDLRTKSK